MRLLWEHGVLKPSEIQKLYPSAIKNSALRPYLKILMEKGHVSRRKVGKAYEYQAVTRRRSAFRSTLRDLIDAYCEGSSRALIVNLIRSENIEGRRTRAPENDSPTRRKTCRREPRKARGSQMNTLSTWISQSEVCKVALYFV